MRSKCAGPTTVGINDLVNFSHDADGFGKGDDNILVVGDIVSGELTMCLSAVVKPLLADLVATDVEIPYILWIPKGRFSESNHLGTLNSKKLICIPQTITG